MAAKLIGADEVKKIDRLIPEAVRYANTKTREQHVGLVRSTSPGKWPDAVKITWNQLYHDHMDELAKAEGLRQ